MQKITFETNHFTRKVMRYFFLLQILAMMLVFALIVFHIYFLALSISLITFLIFIGVILWLYSSYQRVPLVKEKLDLQQKASLLQKNIHHEASVIRATNQKRENLFQNEKKEKETTLLNLQRDYIQKGLSDSKIKDAVISGVGPKLKERLATYRVITAADVTNKISQIPGFGEAKLLALVGWRSVLNARLDKTKPAELSKEQLEGIKQKYQVLQEQNDINEKKARDNHQQLETNLHSIQSRLKQLASITFKAYLGNSLSSQEYVAAFIALILIATQTVSGLSATSSAIIASIPTATVTPTITFTPTNTFTPTVTLTSTITLTPIVTNTHPATFTSLPTQTQVVPTFNFLQDVTAICQDGSYSYSQHRRGTCSHHGGVKQWINSPPN